MESIALFDTKPYDRVWFDRLNQNYQIHYLEPKLTAQTAALANGCRAVVPFVSDTLDAEVLDQLCRQGVELIALRCAGFNHVDLAAAKGRIAVTHVPGYSPYAVAEHTMGLLLSLCRKLHKAYARTREFNFSLNGLTGVELHGKTAGILGTGAIGRVFLQICKGFGMQILAYDPFPAKDESIPYVSLETLFAQSDVISLHCPLTQQSRHLINRDSIAQMKHGVYLLNSSRGGLIDGQALLEALQTGKIAGAGLDVYEEETGLFFADCSEQLHRDAILSLLLSQPNVLLTAHQAFLTDQALQRIAEITLQNLDEFFSGKPLQNRIPKS